MFIQAKLIFQSYIPEKLEKGMMFIGMQHKEIVIYTMNHIPTQKEDKELFIQLNGFPVKPYIYFEGNPNIPKETYLLVSPKNIGWIDEGDDSDELRDIELKDFNNILNNDGWIELEVLQENEESPYINENNQFIPIFYEHKVTIKY
jgi:hypothetical protein